MPKENNLNSWEFEKLALQRNDDAIRFSETKAALLLALTGILLGTIADKIALFKNLLQSPSCTTRVVAISSMVTILIGIIIVAVASLAAVFPRLHVTKNTSYLYFGHLAKLDEQKTIEQLSTLDSTSKLKQVLSQIHATSKIATRKFRLIQLALCGTVLVLTGALLAFLAISLN